MKVWKSGPIAPCTSFPQGENSKPYQAASPSGRGARTCCLSDGCCLSAEVATAYSSCPGVGQRWAVEHETSPRALSAESPPMALPCPRPSPNPCHGPGASSSHSL